MPLTPNDDLNFKVPVDPDMAEAEKALEEIGKDINAQLSDSLGDAVTSGLEEGAKEFIDSATWNALKKQFGEQLAAEMLKAGNIGGKSYLPPPSGGGGGGGIKGGGNFPPAGGGGGGGPKGIHPIASLMGQSFQEDYLASKMSSVTRDRTLAERLSIKNASELQRLRAVDIDVLKEQVRFEEERAKILREQGRIIESLRTPDVDIIGGMMGSEQVDPLAHAMGSQERSKTAAERFHVEAQQELDRLAHTDTDLLREQLQFEVSRNEILELRKRISKEIEQGIVRTAIDADQHRADLIRDQLDGLKAQREQIEKINAAMDPAVLSKTVELERERAEAQKKYREAKEAEEKRQRTAAAPGPDLRQVWKTFKDQGFHQAVKSLFSGTEISKTLSSSGGWFGAIKDQLAKMKGHIGDFKLSTLFGGGSPGGAAGGGGGGGLGRFFSFLLGQGGNRSIGGLFGSAIANFMKGGTFGAAAGAGAGGMMFGRIGAMAGGAAGLAGGPIGLTIMATMAAAKAIQIVTKVIGQLAAVPARLIVGGLGAISRGLHELQGDLGVFGAFFEGWSAAAGMAASVVKSIPLIGNLLGPMAEAMAVVPGILKDITSSLVNMARVASPGAFKMWQIALEDTQGVIGHAFVPVLNLMREAVRFFGDVLATILPNAQEMAYAIQPLVEGFGELRQALGETMADIGPMIRQGIIETVRLFSEVLREFMHVVAGIIPAVGDLLKAFLELWRVGRELGSLFMFTLQPVLRGVAIFAQIAAMNLRGLAVVLGNFTGPVHGLMKLLGMAEEDVNAGMRSSVGAAARPAHITDVESYVRQLRESAMSQSPYGVGASSPVKPVMPFLAKMTDYLKGIWETLTGQKTTTMGDVIRRTVTGEGAGAVKGDTTMGDVIRGIINGGTGVGGPPQSLPAPGGPQPTAPGGGQAAGLSKADLESFAASIVNGILAGADPFGIGRAIVGIRGG